MVFSDNVGKLFASCLRPVQTTTFWTFDLIDITNTPFQSATITPSGTNSMAGSISLQVGKGLTPPTPQDYNVEDPFIASPESNRIGSSSAVYNLGSQEIVQNTNINNCGGSGSVSEVCTYTLAKIYPSAVVKTIILTRNKIDPAVPFVATNNINLDTKVTF